jgi:hypothetical protein
LILAETWEVFATSTRRARLLSTQAASDQQTPQGNLLPVTRKYLVPAAKNGRADLALDGAVSSPSMGSTNRTTDAPTMVS